ncbi:hypothetical protein L249_1725, partial [Ophiocordyceps polyrhachis-furcata BCC 54312]
MFMRVKNPIWIQIFLLESNKIKRAEKKRLGTGNFLPWQLQMLSSKRNDMILLDEAEKVSRYIYINALTQRRSGILEAMWERWMGEKKSQ